MSFMIQFIFKAYSRLLHLYPPRFRDEFTAEMQTVFRYSVMEAAEEGTLALIRVCSREFMDMPFNILREFWHEIQGEDKTMQDIFLPWKQGTWGESLWAALPHLFLAILAVITGRMTNNRLASISGLILGLFFLAGLLVTIFYTWRNHWPAWSASWYGYIGLVILLFGILPYQSWVGAAARMFAVLRFVMLLSTLAVLLYWLSRRNPIEGLLVAIPVVILYWFPAMEFIPGPIRFWLTFWLFLLSALTAMTITRLNNIQNAIWLVLVSSLLSGLPIAYARIFWNNVPTQYASAPTLGQMAELFTVRWLTSSALVIGPILGWGLWYLGRKYGRAGRISAILMILGMVFNFMGHFIHWWRLSHQSYLNALQVSAVYYPSEMSSLAMVQGGLVILVIGALPMVIRSWTQDKLLSIPLIIAPLILPLVAMFTVYFDNYVPLAGFSFQFVTLADIDRYLILLIGVLWLVMSSWTVTRLYARAFHEEAA